MEYFTRQDRKKYWFLRCNYQVSVVPGCCWFTFFWTMCFLIHLKGFHKINATWCGNPSNKVPCGQTTVLLFFRVCLSVKATYNHSKYCRSVPIFISQFYPFPFLLPGKWYLPISVFGGPWQSWSWGTNWLIVRRMIYLDHFLWLLMGPATTVTGRLVALILLVSPPPTLITLHPPPRT